MNKKETEVVLQRIENWYARLPDLIVFDKQNFNAEFGWSKEPTLFQDRMELKYKKIEEGESWGEKWESAWFHLTGEVPKHWSGKQVATDLDFSLEKNIKNLADSLNKDISDITACLLDRPRHAHIIEELKKMKVKMKLISDGDVSGALMVTDDKYNVDIFLGIGGGPEGVLAASAIDAYGCKFQGRFLFNNDKDILRAKKMGIKDLKKKYDLKEIIKGDSIFCATGITTGDLVKGVYVDDNKFITETLLTHKYSNMCKIVIREDTIKT